jgi:uncharacterized Zn-finger protein
MRRVLLKINFAFHRVHMNLRKHACYQCDRKFGSTSARRDHELLHIGVKFACFEPGCSSTLKRRDALVTHLRQSHSLSNEEMTDYKSRIEKFYNESVIKLNSAKKKAKISQSQDE